MKTRNEGKCSQCGGDLAGLNFEETHTKKNLDFCSYVCMDLYYDDEIPVDEDFIFVA